MDFYYVPPNGSIPYENPQATKNKDYYESEEDLKMFIAKEYRWRGEPRHQVLPDLWSSEQDLWSKMKLLGWRYLEDKNYYLMPGAKLRRAENAEQGIDYFTSWKRVMTFIQEFYPSMQIIQNESNKKTPRKGRKTTESKASKVKGNKTKVAKKTPTKKHSIKSNEFKEKKSVTKPYKPTPKSEIKTSKTLKNNDYQPIPEDKGILKPTHPLHRQFRTATKFLENIFDQDYCLQNAKLIHVVGGATKVSLLYIINYSCVYSILSRRPL